MPIKQIFALLLLSFTVACASGPAISNFAKYQQQFAAKSSFMPSKEQLDGKLIKVAVFPFEENGNQVASQSQLGVSLADNIENILGSSKIAQIVDRKGVAKLQKEVQLAEMKKTGSYKGPQVADYAISGTISNAAFNGDYSPGGVTYDPMNRRFVSVPPQSTFVSIVSGNIKIYELPSLTVLQTIEFNAKKKVIENAQSNGGVNIAGIITAGGREVKIRDRDDGMVRRAGLDAINDVEVDIKNALAKRGYVVDKRSYKDKSIFKINLGSSDGIKAGEEFEVIGKYEIENQLTNELEVENRIIASGKVSKRIDPESSWVVLEDSDQENQVRLGDMVKMKYKKGAFAWFTKMFR